MKRSPWQRITSSALLLTMQRSMRYTHVEWSPCSTWLALASLTDKDEGQVDFVQDSGIRSNADALIRATQVASCGWHPTDSILALGWADGCLTLTCPSRDYEGTFQLSASVLFLQWSHNGKVLCCLDRGSSVALFSYSIQKKQLVRLVDLALDSPPCCVCLMNNYQVATELGNDENAQELNEEERQKLKKMAIKVGSIGTAFLVATDGKQVHSISDHGDLVTVRDLEADVVFIGFYEARRLLIVITSDMMLHQIEESNGKWKELVKVKLPGKIEVYRFLMSDNLLLMTYQTRDVRVWDLAAEQNGIISLQPTRGYDDDEVCICLSYSRRKGIISCGTNHGKVASWRRRHAETTMEETWRLQSANQVGSEVAAVTWSPIHPILAVNALSDIVILREEASIVSMRNKVIAVQSGNTSFTLLHVITGVTQELKLPVSVEGLHLGDKQLVVWMKDVIMTFDVQSSLATIQSTTFACETTDVVIYSQTLFCIEGDKINARTMQGTVKQILSLPEMEGDAVQLNLNKNWLVVATSHGFIRVYDISKKEARQEYHSKYVIEAVDDFYKWASVKVNIRGNRVACSYLTNETTVSGKLLIWDAEVDTLSYFSFDRGLTDQQEIEVETEVALTNNLRPVTAVARKMERDASRYRMMLHRPGGIHWDENDDRFVAIDCVPQTPENGDNYILTLFAAGEQGIQLHDLAKASPACQHLVGCVVPNLYFLKRSEYEDDEGRGERSIARLIVARTLREFRGLETCDDATRKAMLDFSLYLALGQMDAAFKAIQFIKNESVWEQMASMSVKTRRLDVAAVCLGHMKNVRGARSLRKAQLSGESTDIQCAEAAIQLGMLEEAEAIYAQNGRYDKINKIQQAQESWEQAFEISERKDRIHLRNTHYNYAKQLEAIGALDAAVQNFEQSDTHHFEVPRMFSTNPKFLENYVRTSREPEMQCWWARYLESLGELDGAINFYHVGKEILNVVRLKSIQGHIDEAAELAMQTGDRAACYHMARVFEGEEEFQKAVTFYSKAKTYASAIRLAREHDMKDKLANLCLLAGGSEMVEAARYYENLPGYAHQAVMLYHKAGMIGRALDLAFRTEQFSALDLVVKDLDASSDPNTLKRASEFFVNNQNYEKGVELLSMAKEYDEAVNLCRRKNVHMNDRIAELLTPTKTSGLSDAQRKELLCSVAELCTQQGSYIIAAKKYTQAGEKIKAMKSLLRSGDTQKIRFFANTARSKDIYLLAANFLQTTDWQGNPEIVKDIETFYAKAQSPEHLANFYITCAHMEVENWNDFDKAMQALEQATLGLNTAIQKNQENHRLLELNETVQSHLKQLEEFQKIKEVYATDQADAVRQLTSLAEKASTDDVIKPSTIFSLLITHHAGKENWTQAYRCITQLKKQQPNLDLTSIVATETLDRV